MIIDNLIKNSCQNRQTFINEYVDNYIVEKNKKLQQLHGVVHTPLDIVNFQIDSLDDQFQQEYNISIYDRGVPIVDPFVGSGTYVCIFMDKCNSKAPANLQYKYENDIFCNEIIEDIYIIAKNNIEELFFQLTGIRQEFNHIRNVDSFTEYEDLIDEKNYHLNL